MNNEKKKGMGRSKKINKDVIIWAASAAVFLLIIKLAFNIHPQSQQPPQQSDIISSLDLRKLNMKGMEGAYSHSLTECMSSSFFNTGACQDKYVKNKTDLQKCLTLATTAPRSSLTETKPEVVSDACYAGYVFNRHDRSVCYVISDAADQQNCIQSY